MDIKELRQRRGLSQLDLARLVGMKQPIVSDYERGVRNVRLMSAANADKFCRALNCSLSELLGD
jgi:transcriptional regulator with XRE-family HTH domain